MSRETPLEGQENQVLMGKISPRVLDIRKRNKQASVITIKDSPSSSDLRELKTPEVEIAFSKEEVVDTRPHNIDPMVITVRCDDERRACLSDYDCKHTTYPVVLKDYRTHRD